MPTSGLKLLQGTLDLLVLQALQQGASHGYAIASWIRATTADRLQIEDGALYTALHRMHRRGWLESEWGLSETNRRARFYTLTAAGRSRLTEDARTWREYAAAVFAVLNSGEARPSSGSA